MDNPFKQVGDLIDEKVDALETRIQIRLLFWGADFLVWLAGVAAAAMRDKAAKLQQT